VIEKSILDISEVAKRSGLPVSTLRFYEEKGLIEPIGRIGLRRTFDRAVLERLALITLGRNAGFSLEEIATLFTLNISTIDRTQLSAKADQLDQTIQRLTAIRDGLRHAAECTAPSYLECPTFKRLMRLAVKNQYRKRRTAKAKSIY
jgi:DNA-binding transcriptional MerR regulator